MPFPLPIREKALVACGRRCCICHVFAGSKIECHHIIPEFQDGSNDFENCIPLCFNCHAEVQHYNPVHPKGTKFHPNELRLHRNLWYEKVSAGSQHSLNLEFREVDRTIFANFRAAFPDRLVDRMLHTQCWGSSIRKELMDEVYNLDAYLDLPEAEYLDPFCESQRAAFKTKFREFCRSDDFMQISPNGTDRLFYRIPKEWDMSPDYQIRKQFQVLMDNLNDCSNIAYAEYRNMCSQLRKTLVVL